MPSLTRHQAGLRAFMMLMIECEGLSGETVQLGDLGKLNADLAPWDDPSVVVDALKDEFERHGWLLFSVDPEDVWWIPRVSTENGGFVLGICELGIEHASIIPVRYCVFGPTGFYTRDVYWATMKPGKHAKIGRARAWLRRVINKVVPPLA